MHVIKISAENLEDIIKDSIIEALKIEDNNRLRSTLFVSNIANRLFDCYKECREKINLNVIGFDETNGNRIAGESMLDITIAKTEEISDPTVKHSKAVIGYQLIWAVESESDTGLPAFAADFGKLLCTRSEHYLYLNGLDQMQPKNQKAYIERRLLNANMLLEKAGLNSSSFYYAFWPSPAKNSSHEKSFWDLHSPDELVNMVRVFKL